MDSNALDLTVHDLERKWVLEKTVAECESHGAFVSITRVRDGSKSGCPKCADERQAIQDEIYRKEIAAKIKAEVLERKLGSSMIPKRFAGKSFDDYIASSPEQEKNLRACKEYAEKFAENLKAGRSLLLLGKPGTGKTHLAVSIAWKIMVDTSHTAVYRTVGGILQLIKGSYGNDAEYTEAEAYGAFTSPSLMIIDEVGATKPTEFELATLFAIINARYEEQLPTIVISNLQPTELGPVLGERSVDRLREGGGIALVFNWDSERKNLK